MKKNRLIDKIKYTYLKRMYTVNMIIEMVKIKEEQLKKQKKEEMGLLEEHHKICKTCWSGQDKVVGRRCSGCINHNEYEPI